MKGSSMLRRDSTIRTSSLQELGGIVDRQIVGLEDGWYLEGVSIECEVEHIRNRALETVRTYTSFVATVSSVRPES